MARRGITVLRCTVVLCVLGTATALAVASAAAALPRLARLTDGAGADALGEAIRDLCLFPLAAGCAWLTVLAALTILDAARTGGTPARSTSPVRRLILAACGIAITAGMAQPASAAELPSPSRAQAQSTSHVQAATAEPGTAPSDAHPLSGLALPERAQPAASDAGARDRGAVPRTTAGQGPSQPVVATPAVHRPGVEGTHVVLPGESLWSVARSTLPADADVSQIDQRWRAIWLANSEAIGADPDLIHPGLTLRLPASDQGDER